MYLPNDLLEQARGLAHHEKRGAPRQVNLRRAISAAYYSLFHLLIDQATKLCVPDQPSGLRSRVRRAFDHGKMRTVCRTVSGQGKLPAVLADLIAPNLVFSADIQHVAKAFVSLQGERHRADYDADAKFARSEVESIIELAHEAYAALERSSKTEEGNIFLVALLLHDRWDR